MRQKEIGFTLIELMFAIFVGMLLLGAAYLAMNAGQRSSAGVERKVAAQQDVRAAIQIMGLDLSMASYNPHYAPDIWHNLPGIGSMVQCTASGNQTFRGIREATPTAITIQMDIGESNLVGDDQGEIIRYNYDLANQSITRETSNCNQVRNAAAAAHFLGDTITSGRPRSVRVINAGLNLPIFRYYNGVGQGTPLPINCQTGNEASCGEIPNIRRIDITLAVETDEVDQSTGFRKRMTYSTSVLVRNHAF